MCLCECQACVVALRAEVAVRPRTAFVLKTNFDRIVVTAERLLHAIEVDGSIDTLLFMQTDWVREVFVCSGSLPLTEDYQSTCEREGWDPDPTVVRRRA